MDLMLGHELVKVSDADLLGEGGEARVYRFRDLALKIFHASDPSMPQAAALLDLKLKKLARFPHGLPAAVVAPVELLRSRRGAVVGYAMRALLGAEDFARLSQRKWREGVVPTQKVMGLFNALHTTVSALHARQVIVGDLNDGNVLFKGDQAAVIDADSMQFDGLPCVVGHERFLDPRLYGVDLTRAARFEPGTDWYAFAVMLFSSLLYMHPFGGTHGKLGTLLRRAEARHSALKPDVMLPRTASSPKVLSDDALHWFERVFEKNERTVPPKSVLGLTFARCACGLEHARAVCPDCHALGVPLQRQVIRAQGRCTARTAFQTSGRIVAAAMQGGLRYLFEEGGVLRREDGTMVPAAMQGGQRPLSEEGEVLRREAGTVLPTALLGGAQGGHGTALTSAAVASGAAFRPAAGGAQGAPDREALVRGQRADAASAHLWGMAFALSGATTWVADARGGVDRCENGRVVERLRTQVRGTTPVLAASTSAAWREEGGWLIDCLTGARVGQVLEAQTWLWAGERLGLGFYRAGGFTFAFLLRAGKAGLLKLEGVSWQGRVVDASAVFDARHALLSVVTEQGGKETVVRWLFDDAGKLVAKSSGGSRGNAAVMGGRVVLATDAGLVGTKVDSGVLLEAVTFADTQPFVGAGDELLAQPDGSLFVVGTRDITQLTLT